MGLFLALSKPRVRRLIQTSGFFHVLQRENGAFLRTLARMIIPADRLVLDYLLEQMATHRRTGRAYFLFANLYDVHAPYPPRENSPLAAFDSLAGWIENVMLPRLSTQLGGHAYLRTGFHFSPRAERILRDRYHRAVAQMDAKLAAFWDAARGAGLLDDTMVVVTADHGEAFGEHDLYFHDASVYDTHLHVPLFIHHPDVAPAVVDDVVSTRSLAALLVAIAERDAVAGTLLDPDACAAAPVALAEHFHYPHLADASPRWMQDVAAAIVGRWKCQVRREGISIVDLAADPDEVAPMRGSVDDFAALARADRLPPGAIADGVAHLRRWAHRDAPQATGAVLTAAPVAAMS
jgi:hypothetical protein